VRQTALVGAVGEGLREQQNEAEGQNQYFE